MHGWRITSEILLTATHYFSPGGSKRRRERSGGRCAGRRLILHISPDRFHKTPANNPSLALKETNTIMKTHVVAAPSASPPVTLKTR